MPSLSVNKNYLLSLIEKQVDDSFLEQMIFDFGIELDDIYEENGEIMYKFDIPANRYDLLCAEGLAMAMKSYMFTEEYKNIHVEIPQITVIQENTHERKFIACAVIKDYKFTDQSYESFISYQDKLHLSIGRNRSIVAIGTHDLDKINGEIRYKSVDLSEINFVPLNSKDSISGSELINHFEKDKKISKYFSLFSDPKKSVVFQAGSTIMSVPPIINSEATKISKNTKNIFIEATGTDFNRVNTAVKLILYNFRGSHIEAVRIKTDNGIITTPHFNNFTYPLTSERFCMKLNLDLTDQDIKSLLTKMMYDVSLDKRMISVPDVRSDVMHECDVVEDLAVGFGFNNFVKKMPHLYTAGVEDPLNKFTDKIRLEMALSGFNEVLTLTLLSAEENFVNSEAQVVIGNPKSKEFEVARTSLLPGLLKSVASNLHSRIPIKVFEAADVVILSNESDEGAVNKRHFCGLLASNTSMMEDLQGPLSFILEKCGIFDYKYEILSGDSRYLENQAASVIVNGMAIGTIGVLHPSVCCMFKLSYAASSFEVDLEKIYQAFKERNN